ncbi:unnamed protein product, partial [Notodromas monacha]
MKKKYEILAIVVITSIIIYRVMIKMNEAPEDGVHETARKVLENSELTTQIREKLIDNRDGSRGKLNLTTPFTIYGNDDRSQIGQSRILQQYFNGKVGGTFFEAGAYDGEDMSNTLYQEVFFNWTGLLVEASPDRFSKLVAKNRRVAAFQSCISPNGQVIPRPSFIERVKQFYKGTQNFFEELTEAIGEDFTDPDPSLQKTFAPENRSTPIKTHKRQPYGPRALKGLDSGNIIEARTRQASGQNDKVKELLERQREQRQQLLDNKPVVHPPKITPKITKPTTIHVNIKAKNNGVVVHDFSLDFVSLEMVTVWHLTSGYIISSTATDVTTATLENKELTVMLDVIAGDAVVDGVIVLVEDSDFKELSSATPTHSPPTNSILLLLDAPTQETFPSRITIYMN